MFTNSFGGHKGAMVGKNESNISQIFEIVSKERK